MEFRCRVATAGGEITEAIYIADSEAGLRHDLEQKGLYLLAVRRKGALGLPAIALPGRRRVPTYEFLIFNQELATLLKAGMPLVQSLEILRRRAGNPVFKAVLDDVYERVRAGSALSEAFEAQGDLFPKVYTASLLAGEKSGGLEQVIRRYVTYVKVLGTVRRRTLSALVYPMILVLLAIVVVAIIILRVVPEFSEFYNQFDRDLPIATRMIVAASDLLRAYFLVIALGVVGVAGFLWTWVRQPSQRARLDRVILHIPWLGPIAQKFATTQMARTLATLLGGGIPVVNALDIAARSMGNRHMARELDVVAQRVREGQALATTMADRKVFPEVAIKMVEVGESTGALQEMLNALADFYDEEIEANLGRFVTLVEPILLVVMGLVIAGLLLALYMPLFQLSSVLST